MFTPATRKVHRKTAKLSSVQSEGQGNEQDRDAPSTPALPSHSSILNSRPATGTPAPWSSRLSIPSRSPDAVKDEKGEGSDQTRPVFVSEFPQVVRNAQANILQKNFTSGYEKGGVAGGIDEETSLAWMICGSGLYIWSYSSSSVSKKCVVLDVPSPLLNKENHWAVCMVASSPIRRETLVLDQEEQPNSVGIILCNQTTRALAYWPDIYAKETNDPLVDTNNDGVEEEDCSNFNSIIATPVPNGCIAVACQPNGALWLFEVSLNGINKRKICVESGGNARSLVWQPRRDSSEFNFFLLTNQEIQFWSITLSPAPNVKKLWAHVVVGNDIDLGIKKDLAGQKHVWLLDLQIDERGKELSILVATFCKDRVSSSNYTQYSLLTMQMSRNEKVLEKKAPLQVIIPKARVEDEETLFNMRLRVGGKPSGSVTILSGDGTATVANYWRGSMRLYQFDLPRDTGKVLDASILPLAEEEMESEGGAWVILTEKAGVWTIPEKAVLVGGVEPPERSLSRKGSTIEGGNDDKRMQAFAPRRISSESWRSSSPVFVQGGGGGGGGGDEEVEALLFRAFHDFVLCGGIQDGDLVEKLRVKGAFEKEGETNVFVRTSRSIIDTLAKHWTTNRGADFVASTVVLSLLLDKQQKHQKFLQLLTLSKCHDELSSKQRYSMLNIMEHGEKLSSLIRLRELQTEFTSQHKHESPGSLWKLIQLVGEKARRNNVILMDRDNVEVFYSKISDLEKFFSCASHYLHHVTTPDSVAGDAVIVQQIQNAFEISKACTCIIQRSMDYRQDNVNWYPSLEGLTPWTSQPIVRSGLWAVASFFIEISKEASGVEMSVKEEMLVQMQNLADALLEAYNASIVAKDERGEETKGLSQEYRARTDQLLGCLYSFAKLVAQTKYQELRREGDEDVELKGSLSRDIYSPIVLTAMRHGGHQTLWDICYDLSDASFLRNLMHDCVGFSNFAFAQLIKRGEYSKLLRLGEEFGEELVYFLKDRIDLLWLHNIFMKQFSSASDTLHALALSPVEDNSFSLPDENSVKRKRLPPSVLERRRFLYLSKIAALAGKEKGFEVKIGRIEADLRILKLQEEIVGGDGTKRELIGPVELIRTCLNKGGRELALKAFKVFAFTSSSFRASNRSLLEECWLNAANQDDWPDIYQSSISQGWTDDIILESLRGTVLYDASNECYGPDAKVFEAGFEEVLPLTGGDPCVEKMLMQHEYFPDAGRLMLTAVLFGKEASGSGSDSADVTMTA